VSVPWIMKRNAGGGKPSARHPTENAQPVGAVDLAGDRIGVRAMESYCLR